MRLRLSALVFVPLLLLLAGGAGARAATEPPSGGALAGEGHLYHLEFLRVLPGRDTDYDRFVKTVFRPMLDAMVARGVWTRYSFLTVPYQGPAPCADYNYVFVATLRDFAALDREQKTWAEVAKQLHPDEAERHRLFDEELPRIREMVREEFLQDFDWH